MKTTVALSLALALLLPAAASAAPNDGVVTYSGFLRNAAGAPETGTQSLTFTLYDAASAGNTVWTQTVTGVQPDSTGWFSVVLGASPAAFPPGEFLSQAWLAIKVGGEPEMAPRTKLGAAPYALASDHAGLSGCSAANQILQWSGTAWTCIATPSGTGGFTPPACSSGQVMKWSGSAWACADDLDSGLTTVAHDASLVGTGAAGSPLGLMACADNQILQRVAGAWSCTPTPAGGGGVTSVGATLPLASSGGAAPVISLPAASGISSGYVTAADYIAFSGKAPTANPTFTGTVTAPTFAGSLSGNATTATTALTASTANTANSVAAGVIAPSSLVGTPGATGQVAAKAATDAWTWVTPLAAPVAPCVTGKVLSWDGAVFTCVADANTTYTAGTGLTLSGTQFAAAFTASGGSNGVATTVARGDHSHPVATITQTVPLADLLLDATSIVQTVAVGTGSFVRSRAVTVPAGGSSQTAVSGFAPMPVSANPTLRATIHNPTAVAVTYTFNFFSSGIAAGRPMPDSRWSNSSSSVTIAGGGVGVVQRPLNATAVTSACATAGNCPMAAEGDTIWFSFGSSSGTAYDVLGIQLLF